MKKALLVAVLALSTAFAAVAQPRAIGGRLGYGVEVSYQHNLGDNFLELDLGLPGWTALGLGLTGAYNFIIAEPEWTPGTWTFYAGPGLSIGSYFGYYNVPPVFTFGLVGQVGLSYKFEFPLQLSVDLRPGLGVAFGPDGAGNTVARFYHPVSNFSIVPCIGVRYAF